jgi:repressor LexA
MAMVDLKIPPNKVRLVRRSKLLTMEQLAAKIGEIRGQPVHLTTIAKIERSQRQLSGEMLSAIAQALDVPPEVLVENVPMSIAVRMVPLIGRIAAGKWREAIMHPDGYIPAPVRSGNAFALRPDGDSMNLVVGEDAVIIVDPDQPDLHDGRLYAVMNSEGETTFKRFRGDPPRLEPVSNNPVHQVMQIGREPFTVLGRVIWQGSHL